jgi:hypothetical protein
MAGIVDKHPLLVIAKALVVAILAPITMRTLLVYNICLPT